MNTITGNFRWVRRALPIVASCLLSIFATSTWAQTPRKVTLTYADYLPANYIAARVVRDWAQMVKDKTNGSVDFKFFHSAQLISAVDMMPGIREGRADIGFINTLYQPGEWPTASIDGLPFITSNAEAQALAYMELYRTNPVFAAQWTKNNLHLIARGGGEGSHIGVSPRPVKSLKDLEGKTMRVCSWVGKALSKLRINPVSISQPEVFEALQRGVLNMTTCVSLGSALDFGYTKIAPHAFDTGTGIFSMVDLVINLDTWKKLPKDTQDIITSTAEQFLMKRQFEMLAAKLDESCAAFRQANGTFTIFPDAEVKEFESLTRSAIQNEWLEAASARGVDGRAVLDAYLPLVRKHEAQVRTGSTGLKRCIQ